MMVFIFLKSSILKKSKNKLKNTKKTGIKNLTLKIPVLLR